ncbi:MAG: hypothetical protein HUJ30_03220 [Gammaproteobacteria bacterium]|nr:hypothetical protein [Gammaproteobacteria bacterium]
MPELIAHRGQNKTFPENTLESMQQAVKCGARYVEFDVQMSLDRVPLVCHDVTLTRTGSSHHNITQHTYAEISRISVGESKRFNQQYQHVYLPTLEQIVNKLGEWKQVQAFVELKDESIEAHGMDVYVQEVMQVLSPVLEQCILIADSLPSIVLAREMAKPKTNMRIGWIVHRWNKADLEKAEKYDLNCMIINHKYTKGHKYDFFADSWDWAMYETCDPAVAKNLFELGVKYVESDDICSMLQHFPELSR